MEKNLYWAVLKHVPTMGLSFWDDNITYMSENKENWVNLPKNIWQQFDEILGGEISRHYDFLKCPPGTKLVPSNPCIH